MKVILSPDPADQVIVVCEWCQHPLRLTREQDLTAPIEDSILAIARALFLHKRVGCDYSERARALA